MAIRFAAAGWLSTLDLFFAGAAFFFTAGFFFTATTFLFTATDFLAFTAEDLLFAGADFFFARTDFFLAIWPPDFPLVYRTFARPAAEARSGRQDHWDGDFTPRESRGRADGLDRISSAPPALALRHAENVRHTWTLE